MQIKWLSGFKHAFDGSPNNVRVASAVTFLLLANQMLNDGARKTKYNNYFYYEYY